MRFIFEGSGSTEIEPSLSEDKETVSFLFRKIGNNNVVIPSSLSVEEFYNLHSYLSELIREIEYEKDKKKSFWSNLFGS